MNNYTMTSDGAFKRGFTLIELLIVIGILAILATTVVLVLNPAQILAETRDTQRQNDLDVMRSAINLYLTTATTPDLDGTAASAGSCAADTGVGTWWTSNAGAIAAANKPFTNPTAVAASQAYQAVAGYGFAPRAIDGSGWLPVPLSGISGGSPVAVLPIDPNPDTVNALISNPVGTPGGRYYAYQCNGVSKLYEIDANMESTKYNNTTCTLTTGPEGADGGTSGCIYEVGNSLTL